MDLSYPAKAIESVKCGRKKGEGRKFSKKLSISYCDSARSIYCMRRSNCSAPIPTGTPRDITFWGVAPVFSSLYLSLAQPYI